jgi:CRP/FNR family transcriptional regulator, anaerobic regulatory protein
METANMTVIAPTVGPLDTATRDAAHRQIRPLPSKLTAGLSAQDMLRVNAARPTFRSLKPGETLYFQGDEARHIYLLLDGWAFRHHSLEDGRRQILDFALSGAVFGFPATGVLTHGVEALTPCTFSVFTRDNLLDLLQRVPVLGLRFMETMAGAEARAFDRLTSVGRRSARERVANLLMELLLRARCVESADSPARMAVPLMQPHIADALGLASETVCRVLAAMRKDRVLVLRSQKLEVLDVLRLAEEAGIDLDEAMPRRSPPAALAARYASRPVANHFAAALHS